MGGEEKSVVNGDELNMVRCKVDYKENIGGVGREVQSGWKSG